MAKNIRLKDLAVQLGVNASTVSRALHDHPSIPAVTRNKIKAQAVEMGYRPDPALQRLAECRWATRPSARPTSLAFVAWSKEDLVSFWQKLKGPMKMASENLGYGYETLYVADYPNVESAVRVLEARGVAGILALASNDDRAWHGFPWQCFSAVQIFSRQEQRFGLDLFLHDTFNMMLDAEDRICRQQPDSAGIYLNSEEKESMTSHLSHAAALFVTRQWKRAGISCNNPRFIKSGPNALKNAAKWLVKDRVEVAIVMNEGIGYCLDDLNISSPRDVQLIALNRNENCNFGGYEFQPQSLALQAVQRVDSLVRHGERGLPDAPKVTLIPNLWTSGRSFSE